MARKCSLNDNVVCLSFTGKIRKIRNHITDFGTTGAMATTGSCLVSAGYDLDRGNGYLNGKIKKIPKTVFCKISNSKLLHNSFQLNGHTLGFHPQTQKHLVQRYK